ncbi:hypothetical protein ACP0HM_23210 [Escherichia coli]
MKVRSSVDLPQPDGPINAVTPVFSDIRVDVFQGMEFAVVEVQITNLNFYSGQFQPYSLQSFSSSCLMHFANQAYRRPDQAFTPHPAKC